MMVCWRIVHLICLCRFKWKTRESEIKMVIYMSGSITIYKKQHLIEDEELKQIQDMLLYAGR